MARKMKESGIEWIGEIPEGWSVSKVLHCLSMPITDGPHTTPILYDTGIPFVSAEAVSCGNGRIDFSHIRGYISEQFYKECCQKYVPEIDDIYMIKSGATTGRVAIVDTTRVFTIWSPLAVFRCNKDCMLPKFLFYYLQSPAFQKEVEFGWTFGTQQNVGMRSLEQMKVCVPQLNKQDTIANYLDYQCTQIDLLLQKALTSIEEYKKLKQAVITQAVTKTIYDDFGNPSKFRKLRSLCDVLSKGTTPKDIETQNDEFYCIRYLKSENIVSNQLNLNPTFFITAETNNSLERSKLNSGDILFVIAGASIGKVAITTTDFLPANTNQAVAFIRLSSSYQYATKYIWYFLQSDVVKQLIALSAVQSAQPNLSLEDLGAMRLPLPDQMGCLKITDYLDAKCAEIDRLIAKKEQLVKELESYKKSLIYEVVTGKREV